MINNAKITFKFSFIIDGYEVATMAVKARSANSAKSLIRAHYKGRKLTSFLPTAL